MTTHSLVRTAVVGMSIGLSVVMLGALSACQTNTPYGAQPDNVAHGSYPRIVVEAPLNQFIGVDYNGIVVDQATPERPLAITVPVRSLAPERRMNVQYQFTWLDADGRQIGQGGWRYIVMEPRSQERFMGNAMDNRASDYRLEIRSAR